MPRAHGRRKKKRTHKEITEDQLPEVPLCIDSIKECACFVVKRGKVSPLIKNLIKDMRRVMYPYTASSLKEQKRQKLDDYIKAAEIFKATHLVSFSMTENNTFMKVCKLPGGPTATFKVGQFTLAGDLITSHSLNKVSTNAPLLVMSGFGKEESKGSEIARVVSVLLQSLFPPINVHAINLAQCKRVVLFNLAREEEEGPMKIEFRHYEIATRQRNVNKAIKRIVNRPTLNLGKYEDVSDFILKQGGYMSDSEAEDLPDSQVTLPQNYGSRLKNTQIAIRLIEVGPRMTLELIKLEEGLMTGAVAYHQYIKKTEKEIGEMNAKFKLLRKKKREEEIKEKEKEERRQKRKEEQHKKRETEKDEKDEESSENEEAKVAGKKRKMKVEEFGNKKKGKQKTKRFKKDTK